MNITEDFIIHFTGNSSTVSNGKDLVKKGSFQTLHVSEDETLIFGTCKGSGSKPYECSVDFIDSEKPVPRCSCPSRQIPCKHIAGLLYCKVQGKAFTTEAIPEDISAKRAKAKDREEKKEQKETAPADPKKAARSKAASESAKSKKYNAQLEGIALAEKILHNIVLAGLHSIDKKNMKLYMDQVKELGSYYIEGIQASLTDLLLEAEEAQKNQDFVQVVGSLNYVYALLKRSRTHTENKIADYEASKQENPPAPTAQDAILNSSIEEQMGYAWKLTELNEIGRVIENARLIQVGFDVINDTAKKQFEDRGIWLSLNNGEIYLSKNFRPYKALKYVKEDDSFFPLLTTSELYIYPGDKNPRARWEKSDQREITPQDLEEARKAGKGDFADVIKSVKNQIKSPLSDKNPIFPLRFTKLGLESVDGEDIICVFDEKGAKIPLKIDMFGFLLKHLAREQAEGGTLICRFDQDMKTDILWGVPVALITQETVLRFMY